MNLLNFRSLALIATLISLQTAYAQEAEMAEKSQKQQVQDVMSGYTLGNDPFYSRALSPAKSLDMNKSDSDRTAEMNDKMSTEIDSVLTAFKSADDDNKMAAVVAAAKALDSKVGGGASAHIEFIDGKPSAAIARALIMIDKTGNEDTLNAKSVLDVITSYKRSAKPSDYSYEYENAQDLTQGNIQSVEGSDSNWVRPNAAAAFETGKDYAIKKCRQIFGWRCVTTLYRLGEANIAGESTPYLFMGNYDLSDNKDNAYFGGDKRTSNQVAGSTAMYVVKESKKWIMVFGVDAQWNKNGISFGSIIQDEYQKDFGRMNQRIALDLKKGKVIAGEINESNPGKKKKKKSSHGPRS